MSPARCPGRDRAVDRRPHRPMKRSRSRPRGRRSGPPLAPVHGFTDTWRTWSSCSRSSSDGMRSRADAARTRGGPPPNGELTTNRRGAVVGDGRSRLRDRARRRRLARWLRSVATGHARRAMWSSRWHGPADGHRTLRFDEARAVLPGMSWSSRQRCRRPMDRLDAEAVAARPSAHRRLRTSARANRPPDPGGSGHQCLEALLEGLTAEAGGSIPTGSVSGPGRPGQADRVLPSPGRRRDTATSGCRRPTRSCSKDRPLPPARCAWRPSS